jgi:hypothetical protein
MPWEVVRIDSEGNCMNVTEPVAETEPRSSATDENKQGHLGAVLLVVDELEHGWHMHESGYVVVPM